jgi:hypothetical protein
MCGILTFVTCTRTNRLKFIKALATGLMITLASFGSADAKGFGGFRASSARSSFTSTFRAPKPSYSAPRSSYRPATRTGVYTSRNTTVINHNYDNGFSHPGNSFWFWMWATQPHVTTPVVVQSGGTDMVVTTPSTSYDIDWWVAIPVIIIMVTMVSILII